MLPGAILWGMSFPLALAAVAARGQDPAALSAASTPPTRSAPSSGRWSTGLILVAWLGSPMTQQILIGIAALSGLLMLMPGEGEKRTPLASTPVVVIGVALLAGLLARTVPPRSVWGHSRGLRTVRRHLGGAE
jgi:spermidine synthase